MLAALLGWALASRVSAEEGRPLVQVFPPKVTGGVFYHWTGVQDERGQLYFGSDVVLSFDGERWRRYAVPGAREIRALALGHDGRLWVGGLNEIGYFERNASGDLQTYHSLTPLLPPATPLLGYVWQVFAHGRGAVFVSSELVIGWDGSRFQIHPLSGARRISAMEVKGEIYVSHLKRGLWHLTANALELAVSPEVLHQTGVIWIDPTPQGWLLATSQGLARLENGRLLPFAPEIADKLTQSHLSCAGRLRDGRICVGTVTAGLAVLTPDGRLERWITPEDGLQSQVVTSLLPTADGGLWVSSPLGLARVSLSGGVTIFDARRGVTSRPVNNLAEVNQHIYLATGEGIDALDLSAGTDARFVPLPEWRKLANDVAGTGTAGSLYVGGFEGASIVKDRNADLRLETKSGVIRLLPSRTHPDRLLVSCGFDLLKIDRDAHDRFGVISTHRFPEQPWQLAEDPDGLLWVGLRTRGLYTLRPGSAAEPQVYPLPGVSEASGRSVVGRAGDTIVLAATGRLAVKPSGRPQPISVENAPTTPPLLCSDSERPNTVWLAYESPFADGQRTPLVGRVNLGEGPAYTWTAMSVPGLEEIGELNRLFVDHRGILWIAGNDGVIRLDPAQARPLPTPPTPVIHANLARQARLPYERRSTTFDFGALDFELRPHLRFETQLSGADTGWTAPSDNTHLTLAGLREGDYELAVRVVNAAGVPGPASSWPFTILPPWYRTKIAYTGWTILAVAGVLGFVQWRSGQLRRRAVRLEELVAKKTAELAAANEAKSEFIATMSHEIRNPISGLVGLSLAMDDTPLDARQQHLSASIRHCANLLATLVDEVLDFAKIEAGHIELRPAAFDLRAVLMQCGEMVRETYRTTQSTLELELAPDLPPCVLGDSGRVQQIVLNYLTNAAKFSGGRPVTLGAAPVGGGRVRLFVRDQGPGMTEAEAATLFTKYTRLHRAQTPPIRGTGLGLAVCRLLSAKMGGHVGVQTAPGAGATFWAELPLPVTTAVPAPAAVPVPTRKLHALVVEDLPYNATAMQAVLQKVGVTSEVASDGPAALARLQVATFDLVFMDWSLPGMDGTEVVRRFRALEPAGRHTIIVATTAYSSDTDREACLRAGMDAFIAKPFTPEKLRHALQDLGGTLRSSAPVEAQSAPEPELPATTSSAEALDLEILHVLAEGEPGGLRAQIDRYFAEVARQREALGAAMAAGDAAGIHQAAHRLLSHANMIKCQPLIRLASTLQALSASTDTARLQRLLTELDAETARLRENLAGLPPSAPPA